MMRNRGKAGKCSLTAAPGPDLRVAAWQGAGVPADIAANLDIIRRRAREARGADLLLVPECFLPGYNIGDAARELAVDMKSGAVSDLAGVARENGLALICGTPLRAGGAVCNAALAFSAEGAPVARHCKRFLYGEWEKSVFAPGSGENAMMEARGWKIGALICYDVEFPEAVRRLAVGGASVVAVPTALMAPDHAPVFNLLPARALENTVFLAYANRVGTENGMRFVGGSRILDPAGRVLARAGEHEEVMLRATLKADDMRRARARFPYLSDLAALADG